MWFSMYDLHMIMHVAKGMRHYVEKVQQPEFAAADKGYTFVAHQQEVGAGYFDDVDDCHPGRCFIGHCINRLYRRRTILIRYENPKT